MSKVGRPGNVASKRCTGKLLLRPPSVNQFFAKAAFAPRARRSTVHSGTADMSKGKLSESRVATITGRCSASGSRRSEGECAAAAASSSVGGVGGAPARAAMTLAGNSVLQVCGS